MFAELIICLLSLFFPLGDNARFFSENDVYNYSTMLLIEDKGVLMLGAREKVYALDLYNISQKRASVRTPFFLFVLFFLTGSTHFIPFKAISFTNPGQVPNIADKTISHTIPYHQLNRKSPNQSFDTFFKDGKKTCLKLCP